MRVAEVMSFRPRVIDVAESVQAAAEAMRSAVAGILPVVDGDELVGVVTDRDLVVRSVAHGHRPHEVTVRQVMSAEPATCSPDDTVVAAVGRMIDREVRRLVVVDGAGTVMGLLTVDDLALLEPTRALASLVLRRLYARRGIELDGTLTDAP